MRDAVILMATANLAAAAAILLVVLLRRLVRAAFGARVGYALWLLVPLAAAASVAPPRPAEVLPAPTIAPAAVVGAAGDALAWFWTGGPADAAEILAPAGLSLSQIATVLWLAGTLLMIGWLAVRQMQFARARRRGEAGPAVAGFFKPSIIVPSDFEQRFDRRERAVVLAHETVHLTRHDARLNALVALCRCVCWFNPLVHLAAHLMRIDQEMACDAAVVERHPRSKGAYAQALLKAQLTARPLPLGCYWPAGTQHPLMERIAMLKTSKPTFARRTAGVALIALLAGASAYAAWAANPADTVVEAAAPVMEEVIAPEEQPPAPPQAHPAPETPKAAEAAPAEVCLTNACAEAPAPVPTRPPLPFERILYVGSATVPAREPFAKRFDGDAPVQTQGKVTQVNMTDGEAAEFMIQGEDGKLYRLLGGDPANLTAEMRASAEDLVGQTVKFRGYLAYDRSCERGCLANGREVSLADGSPLFGGR